MNQSIENMEAPASTVDSSTLEPVGEWRLLKYKGETIEILLINLFFSSVER